MTIFGSLFIFNGLYRFSCFFDIFGGAKFIWRRTYETHWSTCSARIRRMDLIGAIVTTKHVDIGGSGVQTARGPGICLGDRYDYHREIEE